MRRLTIALAGALVAAISLSCNQSPVSPPAPAVSAPNTAPTVTVAFQGAVSCRPQTGQPCTLEVLAQAVDPESDPLTYEWSGCATGVSARASCLIDRAGAFVATVVVNDGHGHRVSAGATGEGLPPENRPPSVAADFERSASCAPAPGIPCTLSLHAIALDPDGDPVTFEWSGCASGSQARASCDVIRPGPVYASLRVRDDHGHVVSQELVGMGEGVNRPPGVQIAGVTVFPGSYELLGNVIDPDDGFQCGAQYCVSAAGAGACSGGSLRCSCLGGLEAVVQKTGSGDICTVTFTLKDRWGEIGTPTYSFAVAPSAPLSADEMFVVITAPFLPRARR